MLERRAKEAAMLSPLTGKPLAEGETGKVGCSLFTYQDGSANGLALRRDNTQVVIAGRHIFKVFDIEDDTFTERVNLRTGKNINLNFSCNDVAWSPLDEQYLATAATNGSVVVWNLSRPVRTKQEFVSQDHSRTVNKVSFHCADVNLLLSGSQDGTMKLFDIRLKEVAQTFISNTESVRDVQFNPHIGHQFVAVSDNGTTQIWDARRPDRAERQFTAHSGPVFACDWHPDYRSWLATAGRDKTIKVWNVDQRCSLEHTVWTIASVGRVKWRPQRKYHLASSALVVDCSVYVWDVRRPYVPFAAFNEHRDVCTGIVWRLNDPQLFLATSKDCFLWQHSFDDAKRPAEDANPVTVAFGVRDDILFAAAEQSGASIMQSNPDAPVIDRTLVGNLFGKSKDGNPAELFVNARSVFNLVALKNSSMANDVAPFVALAKEYCMTGKPLGEICDHNAFVAEKHGKHYHALTWNMIKIIYEAKTTRPFVIDAAVANAVPKPEDESMQPAAVEGAEPEHRTGRHLSGDKSTVEGSNAGSHPLGSTPVNGTTMNGFREDSDSDDGDFPNKNLVDIACAMGKSGGDDFFDLGELDLGAGHFNELNGFNDDDDLSRVFHGMRNGWHGLPTEAFELRRDIFPAPVPSASSMLKNFYRYNRNYTNVQGYEILGLSELDVGAFLASEDLPESFVPVLSGTVPRCDYSPLVAEMVQHYAEMGDIQMAVTLLLVLGNKVNKAIFEPIQEQWCHEYIDLLQRHELWNTSNLVIQLATNLPQINTISQNSTVIHTACPRCHRQTKRAGWVCDTCRDITNTCTVCHQVVRGLYVWCQGCSHGGHLYHMTDWFSQSKECPSGCGHWCEFT